MKTISSLFLIASLLVCGSHAQEQAEVQENARKIEARQSSIVVADVADVKNIEGNKKAVFFGGQLYNYNGIIVKISGVSGNPLVKIREKSKAFPSVIMQKYSDDEWFHYGDTGTYIIEYIDLVDNVWVNEYLEVKIGSISSDIPKDTDVPEEPVPSDEPDDSDNKLGYLKDRTAELIAKLDDKSTVKELLKGYLSAYELSIGKDDGELRKMMVESRRKVLLNLSVRNTALNEIFTEIDQIFIEIGPDRYRLAVEHFISGIQNGVQ